MKTANYSEAGSQTGIFQGRLPSIGLILFLIGILLFSTMAFDLVFQGPLLKDDVLLAQGIHQVATRTPALDVEIIKSTFWLGREVITVLTIALLILWFWKRRWREFSMLLLGVGGGALLWYGLSRYFNRPRPVFLNPIEHLTDPSFPSGHCISALLFYGLIAYLLVPHLNSRLLKALVIIAAGLVILSIGFGRLFVGSHYLTDVLAGYGLGLAWGALIFTGVELYFKRNGARAQSIASVENKGKR